MGGIGSGGKRRGAGRPRKVRDENDAPSRGRVLTHPSAPATPPPAPIEVDEADAPNELSVDERKVWLQLAPHALKNRTLVPETSVAFTALCRLVLRERELAMSVLDRCSTKHMNVFREMNKGLDAFGLRPDGAPIAVPEPAAQPKKTAYW